MQPATRFLLTPDNTRIAYCTLGDGPPLVFVRGWMSNVELAWETPEFAAFFDALAQRFTVVLYDMRGNGLSERAPERIDLETALCDLSAVVDELQLDRMTLYGQCFGGPIAIAYAARHAGRVSRLVLDGTYAAGEGLTSRDQRDKLVAMLRDMPEAAMMALGYYTDPDPAQNITLREHYESQRKRRQYVSSECAVKLYEFGFDVDVRGLLPSLRMPTLVMHRRENIAVAYELGHALAAAIPRATFVSMRGSAANPWDGDMTEPLAAIAAFTGVPISLPTRRPEARRLGPLTIMFTDMESSTAVTQRVGDAAAQELLRAHNAVVRDALRLHGGNEIKHTGDGIMASFASASAAIECGIYVQRALAADDAAGRAPSVVRVRIGINAGEPVAEDDDLFGTSVQLARRVCDAGDPGDVLVSNVVRELCAGKGFSFSDRGVTALKGFEEPVPIYEVAWRGGAA
jgi:class 3 adenylate cyclase